MDAEFLVIQFRASSLADYDDLVALEDCLIEVLGNSAEVDGHDFGSGEFNIFMLAADARAAFDSVRELIASHTKGHEMRAGYRTTAEEEYSPLWPPDLERFDII